MKKIIRVIASPLSLDIFLREQMLYLSQWYEVLGVASPGKSHEKLRQSGLRTEEITIERPIKPWQDLKSLWRLYRLFRRERPWAVHSMTPKAGLLSMTAAFLARVPVRIHTFTGLISPWRTGLLKTILTTTDRITCLFATHVNPEGKGIARQLREEGITKKPLYVIGPGNINGVNLGKFRPKGQRAAKRAELGLADDWAVFSFTGRIVKDKGIEELASAFRKLLEEGANAALILLGEEEPELDPLTAETRQFLRECPFVFMPGQQEDITPWLEASDMFVFPSHREGFPNALLEAGAMSLPSIASDICGCNEIVKDGETGLLIPSKDADALLEAMRRLCLAPDLRREMGERARLHVSTFFDRNIVWQHLADFYSSLGKGNSPQPEKTSVLFLLESLTGGGAEKVLSTIVKYLDKERFDVTVCPLVDVGVYVGEVKKHVHYAPVLSGKGLKYKLAYALIYRVLPPSLIYRFFIPKKRDVEIAFVEGFSTKIIAASPNARAKKIAWLHTDPQDNPWTQGLVYKTVEEERNAYLRYDHTVCVSQSVKQSYERRFGNPGNSIAIYNPIEGTEVKRAPTPRGGERKTPLNLLSIGRFVEQKGFDRLINAVASLIREGYEITLTLVGDGAERPLLESLIEKSSLQGKVMLPGYQSDLSPFFAKADLFVCSSRAEGFSLVIAEAMIAGLPILSTYCSGPNELLEEGNFGILCENSEEGLLNGIRQYLDDPALLESFAEKSLLRAKSFDLGHTIKQIESLLLP